MNYEKKENNIDTTIESLQEALKLQEQKIRLEQQERLAFPSEILNFAQGALNKISWPGLDSIAGIQTAYQFVSPAIESIRKELKKDPAKFLLKATIGAVVLVLALKSIKGKNYSTTQA